MVGVVGFVKKPLLCAKEDINKISTTTEEVQKSVYFFFRLAHKALMLTGTYFHCLPEMFYFPEVSMGNT